MERGGVERGGVERGGEGWREGWRGWCVERVERGGERCEKRGGESGVERGGEGGV